MFLSFNNKFIGTHTPAINVSHGKHLNRVPHNISHKKKKIIVIILQEGNIKLQVNATKTKRKKNPSERKLVL